MDEKVLDKWSHDEDGKYDPEKVEEIRGILRRHNQIPGRILFDVNLWILEEHFDLENKPVRYAATTPDAESVNKDRSSRSRSSHSRSSSSSSSSSSTLTDTEDEKDKNSTVVGFKNEPTFTVNL